jgi:hypothetical protein
MYEILDSLIEKVCHKYDCRQLSLCNFWIDEFYRAFTLTNKIHDPDILSNQFFTLLCNCIDSGEDYLLDSFLFDL